MSSIASPTTPHAQTSSLPPSSNTLDALLSPQDTEFDDKEKQTSESATESEDLALDDVRLSTSSLLEDDKETATSTSSAESEDSTLDDVRLSSSTLLEDASKDDTVRTPTVEDLALDDVRLSTSTLLEVEPKRPQSTSSYQESVTYERGSHKKTSSTNTIRSIRSGGHSRWSSIDAQDAADRSNRGSIDGQLKLQEDFARLQQGKEDNNTDTAIDWDFWGAVMSDYQEFASTRSEELARAIEKGIPETLRGMMWQLMAASKDPELEATYINFLKENSSHEKAITRDLGRTFPHHAFFHDGEGLEQENLFNVLKAYSLYDPQVGYCQGLPFVVAILLLNMPDEEAFSLLVRLMFSYGLRGHFLPEMPRLQLRLFQFDRLLEELLPVLHVHFLRQGIKSSMYCSQWLLTLFSYRFPMDIVFRIFDNCLANGIEAIFGFCINLMQKNEEALLNLKFDEILSFLNNKILDVYQEPIDPSSQGEATYRVHDFVHDALSLRISPFMLDQFSNEYEDMVRTREAHKIEMDSLRISNRNLSAQVKTLEASLAQLNTEHVEVLNELVMSRLRNEEIEEQLVKYKLLYATAMHENQDALSSHRMSGASLFSRRSHASS